MYCGYTKQRIFFSHAFKEFCTVYLLTLSFRKCLLLTSLFIGLNRKTPTSKFGLYGECSNTKTFMSWICLMCWEKLGGAFSCSKFHLPCLWDWIGGLIWSCNISLYWTLLIVFPFGWKWMCGVWIFQYHLLFLWSKNVYPCFFISIYSLQNIGMDRPLGLQDAEVARISRQWHMKVFRSGCPIFYITLYVSYMCTYFSALWCVLLSRMCSLKKFIIHLLYLNACRCSLYIV